MTCVKDIFCQAKIIAQQVHLSDTFLFGLQGVVSHHTLTGLFSVRLTPRVSSFFFQWLLMMHIGSEPHPKGLEIFKVSISKCSHI